MSRSQMKTKLITFCDIKGTVRSEFISQPQAVSWAYYVGILKRLREAVLIKRPELWPNDWILQHDNAPAQKALSIKQFLDQKIDYWNGTSTLFTWFGSEWLVAVSKNKVCLKGTISVHWKHPKKVWRRHWKLFHNRSYWNVSNSGNIVGLKCIAAQGEHFEGDPSQ
jgi:hypothetical protein